jgi:hypothetical protein
MILVGAGFAVNAMVKAIRRFPEKNLPIVGAHRNAPLQAIPP